MGAPHPPGARNDWVGDWDAIPDPLGGEALPLVMQVYGWLSWATSGTTRGLRNQPFDAVLLWRHVGKQEPPPGGRTGSGGPRKCPPGLDLGGIARSGAGMTGFPGRQGVLRVTNAEANVWLPRALRTAFGHWRYCPRTPPPLQPQPPRKQRHR